MSTSYHYDPSIQAVSSFLYRVANATDTLPAVPYEMDSERLHLAFSGNYSSRKLPGFADLFDSYRRAFFVRCDLAKGQGIRYGLRELSAPKSLPIPQPRGLQQYQQIQALSAVQTHAYTDIDRPQSSRTTKLQLGAIVKGHTSLVLGHHATYQQFSPSQDALENAANLKAYMRSQFSGLNNRREHEAKPEEPANSLGRWGNKPLVSSWDQQKAAEGNKAKEHNTAQLWASESEWTSKKTETFSADKNEAETKRESFNTTQARPRAKAPVLSLDDREAEYWDSVLAAMPDDTSEHISAAHAEMCSVALAADTRNVWQAMRNHYIYQSGGRRIDDSYTLWLAELEQASERKSAEQCQQQHRKAKQYAPDRYDAAFYRDSDRTGTCQAIYHSLKVAGAMTPADIRLDLTAQGLKLTQPTISRALQKMLEARQIRRVV
jgi:hypothetical protein